MRFDEIVAELVDENLVAGIDRAASEDLALFGTVRPGTTFQVHATFPATHRRGNSGAGKYARKGEEEEKFFLLHLQDLVVLPRNHVDVIATQHDEIHDPSRQV